MMRGRIVALNGVPVAEVKAAEDVAWVLEGDRGITYADDAAGGLERRRGRMVAGRLSRRAAGLVRRGRSPRASA